MARIVLPKPQPTSSVEVVVPPPLPRRNEQLSLLDHALISRDINGIRQLLQQGADPNQICQVRLKAAVAGNEEAFACARLIQVAGRMKRMNLTSTTPLAELKKSRLNKVIGPQPKNVFSRIAKRFSNLEKTPGNDAVDSPIIEALCNYDLDKAIAALAIEKRVSGTSNKKSFNQDKVIGQLILNDRKELTHAHRQSLLHPELVKSNHPELKNVLKEFAYISIKPGRSARLNLNGQVKFLHRKEKIWCRHLAINWLVNKKILPNGKIDYDQLSNKKKMQATFNRGGGEDYQYYLNNCREGYMVEHADWGNFLANRFREMQHTKTDSKPKRMLINSDNHAMACELKIKSGDDGQPIYAVNFYDPNLTTSHLRIRSPDLSTIEMMSMAEQLNHTKKMDAYFKNQSHCLALVIPDDMRRNQPFVSRMGRAPKLISREEFLIGEEITDRKLSSTPAWRNTSPASSAEQSALDRPSIDAGKMSTLLHHGFFGELNDVFKEIAKIPNVDDQVTVLKANKNSRGWPGVLVAAVAGKHKTVEAYVEGVLKLESLSAQQKTDLLAVTRSDLKSIIQMSMLKGDTKIVRTFTNQILNAGGLSPEQKYTVLNTDTKFRYGVKTNAYKLKQRSSIPRFMGPPVDVASIFRVAVNRSDLPPELKAKLLGEK